MIKISQEQIETTERRYPGFKECLEARETAEYPDCPHCHSSDTASCSCGIVGRSIVLASATTRIKLHANGPLKGKFFCNSCGQYFDSSNFLRP